MPDYPSRKAYREAQKKAAEAAEQEAAHRDERRQEVERDFARSKTKRPQAARFDDVTYKKVNSLKKKLNWAIVIVIGLLVIVAVVMIIF